MPLADKIAELKARNAANHERFPIKKPLKKTWLKPQIAHSRNAIQTKHAEELIAGELPGPYEETRIVSNGSFVVADLIFAVVNAAGGLRGESFFTSLGMSEKNALKFAALLDHGDKTASMSFVLSTYFCAVSKTDIFAKVNSVLLERNQVKWTAARVHAKVFLLSTAQGKFTIEGSANIRSADSIEQLTITRSEDVFAFHREWIEHVLETHPTPEPKT